LTHKDTSEVKPPKHPCGRLDISNPVKVLLVKNVKTCKKRIPAYSLRDEQGKPGYVTLHGWKDGKSWLHAGDAAR
jgi:hypothetical protein